MESILVFRTSIQESAAFNVARGQLNELIGENKWTVDLDDEDKVLRAVCVAERESGIKEIFDQYGFACELMPY